MLEYLWVHTRRRCTFACGRRRVTCCSVLRMFLVVFFFFSSRRRHTRSDRDWSSDVCSSDLDPDSRMLRGFLSGLAAHLEPKGEGWLILSNLAEHLGLRTRDDLLAHIAAGGLRSEEHTSELQSRSDLVCRLLLEKKKKQEQLISTAQAKQGHICLRAHHRRFRHSGPESQIWKWNALVGARHNRGRMLIYQHQPQN